MEPGAFKVKTVLHEESHFTQPIASCFVLLTQFGNSYVFDEINKLFQKKVMQNFTCENWGSSTYLIDFLKLNGTKRFI